MFKVMVKMRQVLKYFYWLSSSSALIIFSQMLRLRKPVPDYLAAYALLGLYIGLGMLVVSMLLAAIDGVSKRLNLKKVIVILEGGVFALFVLAWSNLGRLALAANPIRPMLLPTGWLLLGSFTAGLLFYMLFRARLSNWFAEATGILKVASGLAMPGWILVIGVFLLVSPKPTRSASVSSLQANQKRPNVIYVALDGLTSRDMSLYGYHLATTPNLDRLARSWTVFTNAHSTGTGTPANLPTILTGRYPYTDAWDSYGEKAGRVEGWLNLLEILHEYGYENIFLQGGYVTPNIHHFQADFDSIIRAGVGWYIDSDPLTWPSRVSPALWSFLVPDSIPVEGIMLAPSSEIFGHPQLIEPMYTYVGNFLQERVSANIDRPFFLYMHMRRPHAPYLANEFQGVFLPLDQGVASLKDQLPFELSPAYTPEKQPMVDKLRLRYDENIRKADEELGAFVAMLKQVGLFDQSLIIITADHGANFEGGYVGFYTPLLLSTEHSIPLLVKFPGQIEGRKAVELVSTVDIFPTVLDVMDIPYQVDLLDGQSLLPLVDGTHAEKSDQRVIYVRCPGYPAYAALSGELKLVQRENARVLYNQANDPNEQTNLFGQIQTDELDFALEQFALRMRFLQNGGEISQSPSLVPYLHP